MTRYDDLMARLTAGDVVLIDGATGTEIERRGVPQLDNAWNGGGALSDPDILRTVHEDYIRHGAEIVISNTFATSRHALQDAGVADSFEALNRRGVELAIEARDRMAVPAVLVAGGVSYCTWMPEPPPLEVVRDGVRDQVAIMAAAGADLVMLEMMVDIERMEITLDAALTCGLPVWAGLSCRPDASGTMSLLDGGTLADAVDVLARKGVPVLSIMHTEVELVDGCLDVVFDRWSGPVGVYAHSSTCIDDKWQFDDVISPREYCAAAKGWLDRGVQVVGGCCGVGGAHMAVLGREVRARA